MENDGIIKGYNASQEYHRALSGINEASPFGIENNNVIRNFYIKDNKIENILGRMSDDKYNKERHEIYTDIDHEYNHLVEFYEAGREAIKVLPENEQNMYIGKLNERAKRITLDTNGLKKYMEKIDRCKTLDEIKELFQS